MRLSPAAELAVRGALTLTEHYGAGPVTLQQICQERDLAREYLAKVLGMLGRADIVSSIRGKNGGYVLARRPEEISLLEVIEAVEGPQALNLCQHDPPKCENAETCKVEKVWADLQQVFEDRLRAMRLSDCI